MGLCDKRKREIQMYTQRGRLIVWSWLYVRDEDKRRVQRRETAEGNILEQLLCGRSPP